MEDIKMSLPRLKISGISMLKIIWYGLFAYSQHEKKLQIQLSINDRMIS